MPLRYSIIGAGNMGKNHIRVVSELNGVELTHIIDADLERAKSLAEQYQCQFAGDYQAIAEQVDAVSIVVPTEMHFEVASYFLERGVHVLLEKPIAKTVEEAEKLIQIAKTTRAVLQIGHIERFNPTIRTIKNIINEPYLIEINRLNPASNRISDVGVVLDLQIHDIDLLLYLTGEKVKRLHSISKSFGQPEDVVITQLEFTNGCLANLTTSRVTHNKVRSIGISQKDCYIEGDLMGAHVEISRQLSGNQEAANYRSEATVDKVFVAREEPLKVEIQSFLDAITEKKTPLVTGEDGYEALKIAYEVLEKLKV